MRILCTVLLAAAPALLQAQAPAMKRESDPTNKVAGGKLPAGWHARFDKPAAKVSDVKVVKMGAGMHVTSGPAAIYWNGANTVGNNFTATASFTQTKAPMHPEAYGLFFGGQSLQSHKQSYLYVLVRGDGKYTVKHRANDTDVHTITEWTDSPAIVKADADGKATNTLTVRSAADSVRISVNGTQVAAYPRSIMSETKGQVGVRVNHNLDVHIDAFSVTKQ